MYTYIYIFFLYIHIFGKIKLSINVHVCMHACMYGCMYGKQIISNWVKYVHNLGCFAAKFMRSYSLGNLTLRTSASWICFLENIKKTHDTHTHAHMYVYIFCIYTYLWEKLKPSINVHVCMHAYMYVWMYGKIANKQNFEWNMYTTWLNEICTQLGRLRCKTYVVVFLREPNT